MIKFKSLEINSTYPCSHLSGQWIHYHKCSLYHLPVIFNGIIGCHHSIFFPFGIPGKYLHWYFLVKRSFYFFITKTIVGQVFPAITLLHLFQQYFFMFFPDGTVLYLRLYIKVALQDW